MLNSKNHFKALPKLSFPIVTLLLITSILRYALFPVSSIAQQAALPPVNPKASKETIALLAYINSISGTQTLSGQHCAPLVGSSRLSVIHRYTNQYPAIFGQDFGFSYPGYWDGINYRQNIVDEAIKRHHEGFIITIMWHAVPPTKDEPIEFKEGIQSELTAQEWQEMTTPGSKLNEKWKSQVDVIAWFLKQLKYAQVPVIWRPYHEMNGDWFWWGKKEGPNGYKKLYQMMYDRFINFHELNNLLWVYNTNEVKPGVDRFDKYYPGDNLVDILATDVYTQGFDTENYQQLLALAGRKPIALGEVGKLPTISKLKEQPKWTWFMNWSDPEESTIRNTYESNQVIKLNQLPGASKVQPTVHYPILK